MSGIFTLGKVGIRQGKGTWSTASDVWLIGSPVAVKESPFTYANKGLIPSDDYPGFKEVSIKEALEHYQKNKSKYKKDKKITSKGFLWRDKEDLTQYPE